MARSSIFSRLSLGAAGTVLAATRTSSSLRQRTHEVELVPASLPSLLKPSPRQAGRNLLIRGLFAAYRGRDCGAVTTITKEVSSCGEFGSENQGFLCWHKLVIYRMNQAVPAAPATSFLSVPACLASVLASRVMSRSPRLTPIFLRKALGGLPPAKIQTKSLGISCWAPATSRTTDSGVNSTGLELNRTLNLPERMKSSMRLLFRSLIRLKRSLR